MTKRMLPFMRSWISLVIIRKCANCCKKCRFYHKYYVQYGLHIDYDDYHAMAVFWDVKLTYFQQVAQKTALRNGLVIQTWTSVDSLRWVSSIYWFLRHLYSLSPLLAWIINANRQLTFALGWHKYAKSKKFKII